MCCQCTGMLSLSTVRRRPRTRAPFHCARGVCHALTRVDNRVSLAAIFSLMRGYPSSCRPGPRFHGACTRGVLHTHPRDRHQLTALWAARVRVQYYYYYRASFMTYRPWWRSLITKGQILQFVMGLITTVTWYVASARAPTHNARCGTRPCCTVELRCRSEAGGWVGARGGGVLSPAWCTVC